MPPLREADELAARRRCQGTHQVTNESVLNKEALFGIATQRGHAKQQAVNDLAVQTLRELPPVFRQANTTFVNLRAALDDLDPLVEAAKPATKNLAPFLAELRPVISRAVPVFKNLRLTVARPGAANDSNELLAALPAVQELASNAFPHSEKAIAEVQSEFRRRLLRALRIDECRGRRLVRRCDLLQNLQ